MLYSYYLYIIYRTINKWNFNVQSFVTFIYIQRFGIISHSILEFVVEYKKNMSVSLYI